MNSNILKEISKIVTHDYTDSTKDELNKKIRKEINEELNRPLSPKDLERELEIKQILEEEKRKWESDKVEFEANPLHWSNNKRRRNGLPVLRGSVNKYRSKKFHSFKPTPRAFFYIEDVFDEIFPQKMDELFNQFVEVKDISLGDTDTYYIATY